MFQIVLIAFDRRELGVGLGSSGRQLVDRAMKPRRQLPIEGQPGLDIVKPRRVVFPALPHLAQAVGHLTGLVGQPFQGCNRPG